MSGFASTNYQKAVEEHPFHNHFERPATLGLLPDLAGLEVLDAGCGTGWYSAHMLAQGARVSAIDVTPEMLELSRARTAGKIKTLQHDLAEALPFDNQSFDLVLSAMTLHYVQDWQAVFKEIARVLKPQGLFIFSSHHPFKEFQSSGEIYFEPEKRIRKTAAGDTLTSYRRPLNMVIESLRLAGFRLERLLEPKPLASYAAFDAEAYQLACKEPQLLLIKAQKVDLPE